MLITNLKGFDFWFFRVFKFRGRKNSKMVRETKRREFLCRLIKFIEISEDEVKGPIILSRKFNQLF